ncbi:DivIVA domain-containing protein [Micromonospora zhanjiangensis]|uniref:DivIVA domain-containing protein n=1 Tax=Micromonospora zhanjiangensis TaxID=1522057 RepID=A0ABV8KSG5_9ACTN
MADNGRHRKERGTDGSAVGIFRIGPRSTRLRPEHVRAVRFPRTRFGRRGLAEDHVYAFVRRVVDELTTRDAVEASLYEESMRLKRALREWQKHFGPEPGGKDVQKELGGRPRTESP